MMWAHDGGPTSAWCTPRWPGSPHCQPLFEAASVHSQLRHPGTGRCWSSHPQIQIQNSDHSSVHPCDKIREGKSNLNCFLLCIKPAEQAQIVVYWNQKGKSLEVNWSKIQMQSFTIDIYHKAVCQLELSVHGIADEAYH